MAQCLPNMSKALHSIPSTTRKSHIHMPKKKKKKLACKVVRVSPSKALRMELGFLLPQAKQIKMLFVPEQMKSQSVGVMAIHGT